MTTTIMQDEKAAPREQQCGCMRSSVASPYPFHASLERLVPYSKAAEAHRLNTVRSRFLQVCIIKLAFQCFRRLEDIQDSETAGIVLGAGPTVSAASPTNVCLMQPHIYLHSTSCMTGAVQSSSVYVIVVRSCESLCRNWPFVENLSFGSLLCR